MYVLCHSGGFPFFHLHSECVTKVTQKVIDVVGSLFNGYSVSVMCLRCTGGKRILLEKLSILNYHVLIQIGYSRTSL